MPELIKVFTGFDQREAVGWHVFANSLRNHASQPVAIIPLTEEVTGQRDGSNKFTYSRFLVPSLCQYHGWAIFVDGNDMLMLDDITNLWNLRDETKAVQVVMNQYKTKGRVKYIGSDLECPNMDYPRKNWSSVTLWNCGHEKNKVLNPGFIKQKDGLYMQGFGWLDDSDIGSLPKEWNWLTDEYGVNDEAKILHWTRGIPAFAHYREAPHADLWFDAMDMTAEGLQSMTLNKKCA